MKSTHEKIALKQAINEQMGEHELSSKQLGDLHALLDTGQQASAPQPTLRPWYMVVGMAMVTIFAVLLVTVIPDKPLDMPQLIANEVVRNHMKLKPLEVSTQSLEEVRRHFSKLDFVPINSQNLADAANLIGGRYCSLQGYAAAQLRLMNAQTGTPDTVYQAPYIRETFGELPDVGKNEQPLVVYERGIKVTIWVEKGVLLARTHVDAVK